MFTPIIQILQIDFPELDLIHSVSTGYGGLLESQLVPNLTYHLF